MRLLRKESLWAAKNTLPFHKILPLRLCYYNKHKEMETLPRREKKEEKKNEVVSTH